ncbi:MAG TPA: universal stress protein [Solirubrobacterales bacterium]|jgi:hypothetical protein|nr:universal stress protein [Solirubrobacterales bacterium]
MGDYKRVLVIANETVAGRGLHDEIAKAAGEGAEVHVVAPALSSRLKYVFSDVDGPRANAKDRLDDSLERLEKSGIKATGEVGDTNPVRAFEDAVSTFEPDYVVISTHPPGKSNWLENKVVDRIRDHTDVPVTHVVVDLAKEQADDSFQAA